MYFSNVCVILSYALYVVVMDKSVKFLKSVYKFQFNTICVCLYFRTKMLTS